MTEAKIEDLAYIIKQAKENNQPKPIFFLGAGASKTGNIPLAGEIVEDILTNHSNNPKIKRLKDDEKTYARLMESLQPFERDKILKDYIDAAKINVTHIYLAKLLKEDYVDYVLTVNFDNLMLRALSLYNEFPSTYDLAILNDLTTTTFKEKSVVYLHGQHHGLWLLNTDEEMNKVKNTVPRIFDSIKNKRTWVFIGYSGEDLIFDHIKNLGRFDNDLYWVGYNNHDPKSNVIDFLKTPNTNAFIIRNYDADSFMLKLNNQLALGQPEIIDKPFTSVKAILNNIVDIDDKEHYKGVKERLEIAKGQVDDAIKQFEEGEISSKKYMKEKSEIDLLKKEIIELTASEDYKEDKINDLENKARQLDNNETSSLLAELYFNWGNNIGDLAETKRGKEAEKLYNQSFKNYQKAVNIKADYFEVLNNWGCYLGLLAEAKEGQEAEKLYEEAIVKLQKSAELGASAYNLACLYAMREDKANALKTLRFCFDNKQIEVYFVENDEDWKEYLEDEDFINLLNEYRD